MRRLVLAIAVLASLVLAVAGGALAAQSGSDLKVTGSAHVAGGKVRGGFTVKNEGGSTSAALNAAIKVVGPKKNGKAPKLTVGHAKVPALGPGAKKHFGIKATMPVGLAKGRWSIVVCAGTCAGIGSFSSNGGSTGPNQKKATAPNAPVPPTPATPSPPAPAPPACTPSTGPLSYPSEEPFRHVGECGVEYFGFVPKNYSPSTPMPLLIWAHGCGGEAEGDAWNVGSYEGGGESYLALSLGGRDGGCWNPYAETEQLVMAALADFEAHFSVNTHRVILGGYSSGGDLAYRTAFRHSSTFAGVLIENSAPFEQTESTQAESLAAATTKFHIRHLAHLQDGTYPIANVRSEINALKAAGFPTELDEKPGEHFDVNTDKDLQELIVPTIEKGWTSP